MNGQYAAGDTVLYNWTLTRLIGEGSYGKVFEAERVDFGRKYQSAIKIVTIPQTASEIDVVRDNGMDDVSITTYFRGMVGEMVDEIALMSQLKGDSNVVSYEDHTVAEHDDGIGWDIIIRMELLEPLTKYYRRHAMTREDTIRLGMDICRALMLCQKHSIIHRDIKPENIFFSETGNFKLGDFGVARTVEKTSSGLSKKGTYTYMAPEVYKGEAYGQSVDIYSLGIVMYRLLNDYRAPFVPMTDMLTFSDMEQAQAKRMSGMPLPPPKNADPELAKIVLKACAYDPKERYGSPADMRQELEELERGDEGPSAAECAAETGTPAAKEIPQAPEQQKEPQAELEMPVPPQPAEQPGEELPAGGQEEEEKTQGVFDSAPALRPAGQPPRPNDDEFGVRAGTGNSNYAEAPAPENKPGELPPQAFQAAPQAASPKRGSGKKRWIIAACVVLALAAATGIFLKTYRVQNRTVDSSGSYYIDTKNISGTIFERDWFNSNGELIGRTMYIYDAGIRTGEVNYNGSGQLTDRYVVVGYDKHKNPTHENHLNSDGDYLGDVTFQYDANDLEVIEIASADGRVTETVTFKYDPAGNKISETHQPGNGGKSWTVYFN